jgi:hypothetical protein
MMKKIIGMDVEETVAQLMPNNVELDLARSAWFDQAFAIWFYPFAKSSVLFNGSRGEAFFAACGEFAAKHKPAVARRKKAQTNNMADGKGTLVSAQSAQHHVG